MRNIYVTLLSIVASASFAIPWNQVPRRVDVNTNLVGAVIGEGLSLSNGVLSSTGGGGLSTNDVRAISLTRSEAEAGFTAWTVDPPTVGIRWQYGWQPFDIATGEVLADPIEIPDATLLEWRDRETSVFDITATRTRLRPTPEMEADWNAKVAIEDLSPYARTDDLGSAAYKDASEFATKADEQLVYQLIMGSNIVAEVTNYNSRVRAPSFRLLQLDPDTKEYFTVWAETNGLTRTLNEAKAHTDAATNALGLAKAPRAWSRTTSGLGADAPEGVTWISTPETVIAGGYEYAKHVTTHGEVWVLTSNGMGFGCDSNSYFRVSTPDGETLFSIEKTDEQIVGVLTDGITISGGVVTLDVGVTTYNGQAPICMAAQSVSGPWADLSEGRPAWISSVATNGVNGAWSFELESEASTAFFYFLVRQPGATVIKNSAQADLSGGILVEGTRFYPHKSGSTLIWTTTP